MTNAQDLSFLKMLGARILSEANDLKRTPEALASELRLPLDEVNAVIAGMAPREKAEGVIRAMAETYPLSLADLWLDNDDTQNGVRVMRAQDSRATSRVFDRADRTGLLAPYYEYRDTAMSRLAPFRPEWIQPLRVVDNVEPDNPDVAYNHGHLLHQQTFFVGKVNFYWRAGGRNYCAQMNTGDSNYVTPFVPHSFTSRDKDHLGLIIAVTYAGEVRRALADFGRIGVDNANRLAGDRRGPEDTFRACLSRHLSAESLPAEDLACRLSDAGLEQKRAAALAAGAALPTARELGVLAQALGVRPIALAPEAPPAELVVVRHRNDVAERDFPATNRPLLRLRELARHLYQPGLKGFDAAVLGTLDDSSLEEGGFLHGLHEYVYNYGDRATIMEWEGGREVLEPGDSAYVRPMVQHRFARFSTDEPPTIAIVRIPGALSEAAIQEYAAFDKAGRGRVAAENRRWF